MTTTTGWQITDGASHFFTGLQGACGRWQSICMQAEADTLAGASEPQQPQCPFCKQDVQHLIENEKVLARLAEQI